MIINWFHKNQWCATGKFKTTSYIQLISALLICAFSVQVFASPCEDSLYVHLSASRESELSETEAFYVKTKSEQCRSYRDSIETAAQDSVKRVAKEEKWQKKTKPLIIAGITMGVIGTVVLLAIAFSSDDIWVEVGGHRID